MKSKSVFFFLIAFLYNSCSSDYSPKPQGYFYIELPKPMYHDLDHFPFFKCRISNEMFVEEPSNESSGRKEKNKPEFILNYPRFHARIYCSYFRMNKSDFPAFSEESRRMAYVMERKAKGVTETAYRRPEQKVYGVVYEIQGNAVSPIQFTISDSVRSFFRGALYFDAFLNRDSIAPVLAYINKDIHVMIESFQWKQ